MSEMKDQKRTQDAKELELQTVVGYHVGSGTQIQVLWKSTNRSSSPIIQEGLLQVPQLLSLKYNPKHEWTRNFPTKTRGKEFCDVHRSFKLRTPDTSGHRSKKAGKSKLRKSKLRKDEIGASVPT
ncbi:hypothetical protein STEG23_034872 [Scotinomys teguina]